MLTKLLIVISSLLVSVAIASQADTETRRLIVGTNAEFPPFAYIDKQGYAGLDIELATLLAKALQRELQIVDLPFDALIPQLQAEKIDLVLAGLSYTPERAKQIAFIGPYLYGDAMVWVKKAQALAQNQSLVNSQTYNGPEVLPALTIAVNDGYTTEAYARALDLAKPLPGLVAFGLQPGLSELAILSLPNISDGFVALKFGRADLFLTYQSIFNYYLALPNNLHKTDLQGVVVPNTGENYMIGANLHRKAFNAEVQNLLESPAMQAELKALKFKWLGGNKL